jgi:triacylglycerol lipase
VPQRANPRSRLTAAASLALLLTACSGIDAATGPLHPGAVRRGSAAEMTLRKAPAHDPILFVHGWHADASTWSTMVRRFRADGWTSEEIVNWSYNSGQSNVTTAQQIAAKVDSILAATGATRVDIVSHSMGALSARYYVRNLGGAAKVDAWISLGGTNYGTSTAYTCTSTPCKEMWPGSKFLERLNAGDDSPGALRYATWRSPCDEVIIPQRNAQLLDGSRNIETGCIKHSQLHQDGLVYSQVRDWAHRAPPVLAWRAPDPVRTVIDTAK